MELLTQALASRLRHRHTERWAVQASSPATADTASAEPEQAPLEELKVRTVSPRPQVWCAEAQPGVSLQAQLTDSLFGIDRGLTADSELRAEISELISTLEARNPTQAPNDVST